MADACTVAQALAAACARGIDRLDAQLLLAHRLGRDRTWLRAHDDELVPSAARQAFETDVARRLDDVPLAYLTGQREFHGLSLQVGPAVLDPRPDTETLVDWALEILAQQPEAGSDVLDLGTGSGAVALAVSHRAPRARVTATDASAAALEVAQANARRLGLPLQWAAGSWWQAVPGRVFDLVLSNPPYIAAGDPHLHALRHEPLQALTPGGDGLDAIRAIVAGAPAGLRPGGWLLLEHGFDQAEAVRALLAAAGFEAVSTRRDLGGQPRVTGGRRVAEEASRGRTATFGK